MTSSRIQSCSAAMLGLDRQQEPVGRRLFRSAFLGQGVVEIECAGGVLRRADIEQAREVGEIVSHVGLLKGKARRRAGTRRADVIGPW